MRMSDFWLMDGSATCVSPHFINLSYTFPQKLVNRIRFDNLRVYFNVKTRSDSTIVKKDRIEVRFERIQLHRHYLYLRPQLLISNAENP